MVILYKQLQVHHILSSILSYCYIAVICDDTNGGICVPPSPCRLLEA